MFEVRCGSIYHAYMYIKSTFLITQAAIAGYYPFKDNDDSDDMSGEGNGGERGISKLKLSNGMRSVVNELSRGNYDEAMEQVNKGLECANCHQDETLGLMEMKNIIARLRVQCDLTDEMFGPTNKTNALPFSFSIEMLDVVQKVLRCRSHYEVLRISRHATYSEVKRAYKRLALRLHPDKNRAPGAEEAFRRINEAADTLTDNHKRIEYNMQIAVGDYFGNHIYKRGGAEGDAEMQEEEIDGDEGGDEDEQQHQRSYQPANQRVPQRQSLYQTEQLVIGLVASLVFIIITLHYLATAPNFSFMPTSTHSVRLVSGNNRVPYFVTPELAASHTPQQLKRMDEEIEEIYLTDLKYNCKQERKLPEIDELIEQLKTTSVSPDNTTTLLCEISATKDPKLFDKHELAECFLRLTQCEDTNVRKEAAKCIAEITKSEVQRKKFTKREIIAAFIECLRHVPTADGSMELPIQICRALGNICYLNDEARDLILELKGDAVLLQLLDISSIEDASNAPQFIKVRGGLLSNYLLGGEGLAKRAMELGIMQKLQNIISTGASNVEQHEDLLLNTLPLLSILTENVADLNFEAQLNIQLSRILAASTNPDLAEMCLELLHYQAESDDVKLLLAKDGLCETIYNLLEKYKTLASTSEARALMKLACELIVLILTGDESMHYLYTTPLLKNMVDWLDSTDIDLLTTGVLALGNFARTDSHCIYFVEQQTMNKLLQVLSKNNGVKDDVRLQHALLSALRNLVIPKPNKNAVIQAGLVQTILPMLEIHQPPVVFKLLGTLRMTVDGQEKLALELLKNKTLIEQLVHWSKSSDYAGVTGESLRLMAWLIKHAYLTKIAYALPRKGDAPAEQIADKIPLAQDYDRSSLTEFLANEGTVEAMVSMLTAQHLVMQNEALIALCILSVVYLSQPGEAEQAHRLQDELIKCNVGAKLAELISKSSDSMTKEIVENLQNCVNLLKTAPKLVAHLEEHNINELLKSIPILTEYCTL